MTEYFAHIGQIIRAKRTAATGINAETDWEGLENSMKVRKIEPIISEAEVRMTVGPGLPIEIDVNANN